VSRLAVLAPDSPHRRRRHRVIDSMVVGSASRRNIRSRHHAGAVVRFEVEA
jgi:hypothetical protein